MKTKTRTTKGIAIAVMTLALASASFAQQQEKPPIPGTYYSAKDFEWKPPLPFNPHPDLPAVEFEPGKFLVDDTGVPDTPEQAEARTRWQEADALAKAIAADPVLAAAARQQAEEAARKREADWQARLEAARPFLRSWGFPGDAETQQTREEARTELQELARKAAQARADVPRIEAELDAISEQLKAPRVRVRSDSSKEILGGHVGGRPVYRSSLNLFAAASISADELWPTNSAVPWPHASTGRNLTGTNVTLGLWENDGAVLTNHAEFGNRAWQVDHSATNPIPTDGHATAVAGTMTAGGFYQFSLGGQPARLLRGVAFEARINAYDTDRFKQKLPEAAAGIVTGQPLRLTNKTEAARSAAATTGVDSRNNVEQVFIANPPSGRYRIVVTHSGGLPGGPSPSAQWGSLLTTGDTPLPPVFTAIEADPSGTNVLMTFTADPGAYFHLLSTTDFVSWQTNATVKAEGVTNSVLVSVTQPHQFYRLRRQQ